MQPTAAAPQDEPIDEGRMQKPPPLLPRGLAASLYIGLSFWTVFASCWIGYAMVMQHRILGALKVVGGPWEGQIPSTDFPVVAESMEVLKREPRDSLLYIIQELRQSEINDARMARAIALRKAVSWAEESRRRMLFDALLERMTEEGELESGYELPPDHMKTLKELLQERRYPSDSYEEDKITEVLQWIAGGCPTAAKGPEKRRIRSLQNNYAKKTFFGKEQKVLTSVMEQWMQSDEPVRRSAAQKFALMLDNQHTELSPEEAALCGEEADHWEGLYLEGRRRLAKGVRDMVEIIAREDIPVDHPHLWDLTRLLDLRDKQARDYIAQAVLDLKQRKYTLIYLSEFTRKAAINPVMVVETRRLSKAEHEEELKAELLTLRLASLELLRQIGLQYCRQPFDIEGVQADEQSEFFKTRVIGTLVSIEKDKTHEEIRERAVKACDQLREACPQYFE